MKTLKLLLAAAALVYLAIGLRPVFWPKAEEKAKMPENQKSPAPAIPTGGGDGHRLIWVSAAALSPDGKQLLMGYHIVSSSLRGIDLATVKWLTLWDVETGKEIKGLYGHKDQLVYAAFMPDGKRALSASIDGVVKVWDLEKGVALDTFQIDQPKMGSVAGLAADGKSYFSLGMKHFKQWDISNGKLLRDLKGMQRGAFNLVLSPDRKFSFLGFHRGVDDDSLLNIWDLTEDKAIHKFEGSRSGAFSPDLRYVILDEVSDNPEKAFLALYEWPSFKEVRKFEERPWEPMYAIWFTPDGKGAFSYTSRHGTFRRWDVASGKEVWSCRGPGIHRDAGGSHAFSENGKIAMIASGIAKDYLNYRDEVDIRIWDLETGKVLRTLPSPWLP